MMFLKIALRTSSTTRTKIITVRQQRQQVVNQSSEKKMRGLFRFHRHSIIEN